MGNLSEHFSSWEIACKCKCEIGIIPDPELITRLEAARVHAGIPFVINSGVRCPRHNARVGGVGNSSHLTGKAVDIRTEDFTERYKIIKGLFEAGFERIKPKRGFVHADVDEEKVQEWFGL